VTTIPDPGAYAALDDRELWRLMSERDSLAFGALFDRHLRAVCNHCFRLTASWQSAEELASTTLLRAWQKCGREPLRAATALPWLLTVGTNLARNEQRSAAGRLRLLARAHRPEPVPDPADEVASRLDDEARMRELLAAVRQLPRAEREALALCVWSGVSYADAATQLGIAEVSVRSRVFRARTRLAGLAGQPRDAEQGRVRTVQTGQEDR
jgi:RNA polymerase sigma-70 factor (ECF subfamily)